MWEKIAIIWKVPELRQKILLTLLMLAIYRVGFQIQLPVIDPEKVEQFHSRGGQLGQLLQQVAILSASQLSQVTIFGLGIMPYISASIIFQLLASVYPPLEQLQKEGESGRKKINEYTRYATVFICIIQSWFFVRSFVENPQYDLVNPYFAYEGTTNLLPQWEFISVLIMTAGTIFLMWLGEQIDEYGIGNGISLLIMAGILASMPGAGYDLLQRASLQLGDPSALGPEKLVLLAVMFVAVVAGVVFITLGQRRIPMQSAKHVRGRRVYGGTRQYLPLKVNQAGVMPIIFASSLMMFPLLILAQLNQSAIGWQEGWWKRTVETLFTAFDGQGYLYNLFYLVLIYFFCYFWTAITFNPKDMSENLKNFGSFIPGYRPGKRTADYLEKVMVRITYVGAGFLALVAIIPTLVSSSLQIGPTIANFYGGTSLLIAVSVAFDLVQKIDSHLVMRNYKGLLE